jgi:hypothetical protein
MRIREADNLSRDTAAGTKLNLELSPEPKRGTRAFNLDLKALNTYNAAEYAYARHSFDPRLQRLHESNPIRQKFISTRAISILRVD